MVIVITGVLWLAQLGTARYLSAQFRSSIEKSVAASVQTGLDGYFVDPRRGNLSGHPARLDSAEPGFCSEKRRCFENVLPGGIVDLWEKTGPLEYKGPADGGRTWRYVPETGQFLPAREK